MQASPPAILDEPLQHGDLVAFFRTRHTPRPRWRVGLEHEKLAVRADGRPVPYEGDAGIAALLQRLESPAFKPDTDDGHIIGLGRRCEKISIEPGGQVELAAPPVRTVTAARTAVQRHIDRFCEIGRTLDIHFIHGGFRPFGSLAEVMWLPKRRYDIMRAYLPTRGALAPEMMKRTATMQANFDFADERDAASRMRVAMGLTSVVTAMAAASPISEGRPNGFKSYRAAVWTQVDEDRCGLLPFVFDDGDVFEAYTQWALDVPMFFIERNGQYRPAHAFTFRRFMAEGIDGATATLEDWKLHLSTVFPEVRLKQTIEVRGADAGPLPVALAVAALWRGLLDDMEAREAAWQLVADVPLDARLEARASVPRAGLDAKLGRWRIGDLAPRICAIARAGLSG